MKNILIIWVLAFLGTGLYAQNPEAKEKIESARIGFITKRLGLTPEQAERFWPLYNEFRNKNRAAASEFNSYRSSIDLDAMNEEQSRKLVDLDLDLKQRRLDLEKEYSKRMIGVISTQQVASLRKAERDFRDILRRRIQQARQQQLRQRRLQDRDQLRDRVRDKYRD